MREVVLREELIRLRDRVTGVSWPTLEAVERLDLPRATTLEHRPQLPTEVNKLTPTIDTKLISIHKVVRLRISLLRLPVELKAAGGSKITTSKAGNS